MKTLPERIADLSDPNGPKADRVAAKLVNAGQKTLSYKDFNKVCQYLRSRKLELLTKIAPAPQVGPLRVSLVDLSTFRSEVRHEA